MATACDFDWALALEYLKVLLSWPVLTGAIALTVIFVFRAELRKLIDRIRKIEGFGTKLDTGGSLAESQEAPQAPPTDAEAVLDAVSRDPAKARQEILRWFEIAQHEHTLNLIFGSQLKLLTALAQNPGGVETMANLSPYYLEHQQLAGTIAAPLGNFFGFLIQRHLVSLDGDPSADQRVTLTDRGRNFVDHVAKQYAGIVRPW